MWNALPIAIFANRVWRKVPFRSIDYCCLCWLCCWARCLILQDMDDMEASYVLCVKDTTFDQLEQNKISISAVTRIGINMFILLHDLVVSVSFVQYPGDVLRQSSPDVLSLEAFPVHISQLSDFGCLTPQFTLVTKQTTSDQLSANCWTVETPPTCSHTQQDSSCVECASWLLLIPFWLEADYIILNSSHFLLLSSSSPIPHQQMMATPTPHPGESGSELSRSTGASSHALPAGTQQQCRQHLVHHDAANTAAKHITQDAHFEFVHKTRMSKNTTQDAIGCEYIHSVVTGRQLTVERTACTGRDQPDQIIADRNGKHACSTNALVLTVWEIGHHHIVRSGIFADDFCYKLPCEWTKQCLITLEEAMDASMVELVAEWHC